MNIEKWPIDEFDAKSKEHALKLVNDHYLKEV